jgi:hypothetical protein
LVILPSPVPFLFLCLTRVVTSENEIDLINKKENLQMQEWFCQTGTHTCIAYI